LVENEQILRLMALESRLSRRMLAKALLEVVEEARENRVRARMVPSISGVTYVFFNAPPSYEREARISELGCRCFIARNEIPENETVVGICFNLEAAPQGYAEDLILLSCPEWTTEQRAHAEAMKTDLGFFKSPRLRRERFDEWPEE
jgi:hypothetical protein